MSKRRSRLKVILVALIITTLRLYFLFSDPPRRYEMGLPMGTDYVALIAWSIESIAIIGLVTLIALVVVELRSRRDAEPVHRSDNASGVT